QLAFSAREVDATEPDVRAVLAARLPRDASPADALDAEVAAVLAVPTKRLYVLEVEGAYVFDRDAWRSRGTDARLEVDVAAVWGLLGAGRP
ncbi:hypothetical protein P2P98_06765, partial [Microbacterium sp. Kw_RZR3]|uniref:hypothetical protein n=1 Tax=Microbacterium sp. Kw_RZR3 TaxID=3032903 RepID=UPI0023DB0480